MKTIKMKKIMQAILVTFSLLILSFFGACEKDSENTNPIPVDDTNIVISKYDHHSEWTYNKSIYEVNVRQYTSEGDFKTFEQHLGRLKNMGVGILWLMPIHPIGEVNRSGSLGSYYSVKDYYGVNPEFGSMADFKSLVQKAHSMDMQVIIDWVANHTSWDNRLTLTNPEFYVKDDAGNFIAPPGTDWADVIELDYTNEDLETYMIDALKFWLSETGIDGFRFDAVDFVPATFWRKATAELEALKPDIFMLAEGEGAKYHSYGFDMDYCWTLYGWGNGLMKRIYKGSATVADMDAFLVAENSTFIPEKYRMYFTSNHDENSWEGTVYEQLGESAEVFAVLSQTLYGMPLVYSGQEAGLDKRLLFFDKDEISWDNLPLENLYSTLQNLKITNSALWNGEAGGEPVRINTTADENIFAFTRKTDTDEVLVILNLSNGSANFSISSETAWGSYNNVFTNDQVNVEEGSTITLDKWKYLVLTK